MPNHVANEVIFRDVDAAAQARILAVACNVKGEVDFEILLPPPINYWAGGVSLLHKVFPGDHLRWCSENWSTKWNAYDQKPTTCTGDTLVLQFTTAWRPPMGWLCGIFNTLHLTFEYNWLSEGETRGHSGKFVWPEMEKSFGNGWVENACDDEMQKHLHILRWGCESFPEEEEIESQG